LFFCIVRILPQPTATKKKTNINDVKNYQRNIEKGKIIECTKEKSHE
jgi:hypothetical protein